MRNHRSVLTGHLPANTPVYFMLNSCVLRKREEIYVVYFPVSLVVFCQWHMLRDMMLMSNTPEEQMSSTTWNLDNPCLTLREAWQHAEVTSTREQLLTYQSRQEPEQRGRKEGGWSYPQVKPVALSQKMSAPWGTWQSLETFWPPNIGHSSH